MSSHAVPASGGVANTGPRASRWPRRARSTHRHTLTGPVAWVDADVSLVVLCVERTSLRARRFVGATVTVSLAGARLSAPDCNGDGELTAGDLLPGERISIGVTLPMGADRLPRVICARSVACASFD